MQKIHLILYFSLIFAMSATEYEYPILINPDGTIQPKEFNQGQKFTFDSVKNEIKYFHSEISKILPYLIRNEMVKDNTFTKEIRNFIETIPGSRNQFSVRESFVLSVKDGKLNTISFIKKRVRLNPKMEKETVVNTLSNEVQNEEMASVKLQIDTHTNYTESNKPVSKVYAMTEIPSPRNRIKLLRTYQANVSEALRELDRIVDRNLLNDQIILSNSLKKISVE